MLTAKGNTAAAASVASLKTKSTSCQWDDVLPFFFPKISPITQLFYQDF